MIRNFPETNFAKFSVCSFVNFFHLVKLSRFFDKFSRNFVNVGSEDFQYQKSKKVPVPECFKQIWKVGT
jgi:hypothetical protein